MTSKIEPGASWNLTVPAQFHPSATVPFGIDGDGFPLGLLVNGPLGNDAHVLQVCDTIERATRHS